MAGRTGSKPKLTGPRITALLNALELGCTRRAAAGAADIHHSTLYEWMANDPTLTDAIERAEAKAEATYTAAVANAVPKSWQAAAWWLERRKHADYAQRQHVNVDLSAVIRQVAADAGVDEAEAIAEAERILANAR